MSASSQNPANQNQLIDFERARITRLRASMASELKTFDEALDRVAIEARALSKFTMEIMEAQIVARKAALRLNAQITAALIDGEFDDKDNQRA